MKTTLQIRLPNFSGFYEETGTGDACDAMEYHWEAIDWPKTYLNIAKGPIMELYEERFEDSPFGKPKFLELDMPQFYNYRTDWIFAEVTVDISEIMAIALEDEFGTWLHDNYAPRSGWIPFFPTDAKKFRKALHKEFTDHANEFAMCLSVLTEYYFRELECIGTEEAHSDVTDGLWNCFVFDPAQEWKQRAVEELRKHYPDAGFTEICDHVSDFWKEEESWDFNIYAFRYKAWARAQLYPGNSITL